ncbi:hypothetical protein [Gallaecimonas xiamenensis]|uniref:Uncharacterized protein n=1 Tax=Gallaecimonas xiamenensis 3-C-1 TaxID=745411 RepID=K2JEF3_9GAMM|nr:hypothetical protein [Gallaecimonas xiamenensis]EKE73027.1 hypothetical protein B3C1_10437 [Gallaecimonas xiamenensis 3-C-1]
MKRWINTLKLDYFESLALLTMSLVAVIATHLEGWPVDWLRWPAMLVLAVSIGWFGYRHLLRPGRSH